MRQQADRFFAGRFHAATFLAGLAAFWSGFVFLAALLLGHDPNLGRHAHLGPAEIAAFLIVAAGAVLLLVAQAILIGRLGGAAFATETSLRLMMPQTLTQAAREVGLPEAPTAALLYAILLVGVVTFFTSIFLR